MQLLLEKHGPAKAQLMVMLNAAEARYRYRPETSSIKQQHTDSLSLRQQ